MSRVCAIPHIFSKFLPDQINLSNSPCTHPQSVAEVCFGKKSPWRGGGWGEGGLLSGWVPPSPLASSACATNATNAKCHLGMYSIVYFWAPSLSFRIFDQYSQSKKIITPPPPPPPPTIIFNLWRSPFSRPTVALQAAHADTLPSLLHFKHIILWHIC